MSSATWRQVAHEQGQSTQAVVQARGSGPRHVIRSPQSSQRRLPQSGMSHAWWCVGRTVVSPVAHAITRSRLR